MKANEIFTMNDCKHILDNHVFTTDGELKDRLINGNFDDCRYSGIKVDIASKFTNEEIALKCINLIIRKNIDEITAWTNERCNKRLLLKQNFTTAVGYGYVKHTSFKNKYDLYGCAIILELGYNGQNFNVITSYPTPNKAITKKIEEDKKVFLLNKKK